MHEWMRKSEGRVEEKQTERNNIGAVSKIRKERGKRRARGWTRKIKREKEREKNKCLNEENKT